MSSEFYRRKPIEDFFNFFNNDFQLQVLILATGFKLQEYFAPMQILGKDGQDVLQKWKEDRPMHYNSIVSSDMPNLFNLQGPGAVRKSSITEYIIIHLKI
jgi:cation diffusion facilitator CzcD-associated flavoprotein CzcO